MRLLVVDRLFMESSGGWLAGEQTDQYPEGISVKDLLSAAAALFRIKWIVTNANAGKCCGWPKSTLVCVYACRIHRCIISALVVSISDSSSSKASRFNYILATWLEGTSAATSTYLLSAN